MSDFDSVEFDRATAAQMAQADQSYQIGKDTLLRIFGEYAQFRAANDAMEMHPLAINDALGETMRGLGIPEYQLLFLVSLDRLYRTHRFVREVLRHVKETYGADLLAEMTNDNVYKAAGDAVDRLFGEEQEPGR